MSKFGETYDILAFTGDLFLMETKRMNSLTEAFLWSALLRSHQRPAIIPIPFLFTLQMSLLVNA